MHDRYVFTIERGVKILHQHLTSFLCFGVIISIGLSIGASAWISIWLGDCLAWVSWALMGVIVIRLVFKQIYNLIKRRPGSAEVSCKQTSSSISTQWWLIWLVLAVVCYVFMYLSDPFALRDLNTEAFNQPLTVTYLDIARSKGISPVDFFAKDPMLDNLRQQDAFQAYNYPQKRFVFEHFSRGLALYTVLYRPFIRAFGVSNFSSAVYSFVFTTLTFLLVAWIAHVLYGRFCSALAVLFLTTSLSIVIHTKVAVQQITFCTFLMSSATAAVIMILRNDKKRYLVLCGFVLALMYLSAWIDFAFGMVLIALGLIISKQQNVSRYYKAYSWIFFSAILFIIGFITIYSSYYHYSFNEVHSCIWDVYASRYSQGAVPGSELRISEKLSSAVRWMFWDMEAFDHPDKFLEGRPAVPPFFALSFFTGLFFLLKKRRDEDKIILIWLFSVFGVLGSLYMYESRYAVLGIPAMAITSSVGICQLGSTIYRNRSIWISRLFAFVVLLGLGISYQNTWYQFYHEYLFERPGSLELDRMHGQTDLWNWISNHASDKDTLVVFGDPVMFPSVNINYHNLERRTDFKFVYWVNYFQKSSTTEYLHNWNNQIFSQYKRIIFVFSTRLLSDAIHSNDPTLLLNAYPEIKTSWVYYDNKRPLIVAYELEKSEGQSGKSTH